MNPLFFFLLCGHALADYPLQTEFMAANKNCRLNQRGPVPWYYVLLAHSLIHGGTVAVIVAALGLGLPTAVFLGTVETVAHFAIDHAKCVAKVSIHIDQAAHVLLKLVFALAYA
jgi:hypothetical protein